MTGHEVNSSFCFLRISVFARMKLRETLRFEGKQNSLFLRDQSWSSCGEEHVTSLRTSAWEASHDLLNEKTNGSNTEIPVTTSGHL